MRVAVSDSSAEVSEQDSADALRESALRNIMNE